MIDFIELRMNGLNPSCWLDCVELDGLFATKVSARSGKQVDGVLVANYKNLVFEMVPTLGGGYNMTLRGSLHKYFNGGTQNNNSFSFNDLVDTVEDISARFNIDLEKAVIEGIEFGVNVSLPFPVKRFLNSIVVFKSSPFSPINPRRRSLGKLCCLAEYEIKVYDKAVQSVTDFPAQPLPMEINLLRVEIKVKKMRWISTVNIITLKDLSNMLKVNRLKEFLVNSVSRFVFVDFTADVSGLTDREKAKYHEMRDGERWTEVSRWQRQDWLQQLARLLKKCKAFDFKQMTVDLIVSEWVKQFEAGKRLRFHRLPETNEACKKATFSPLECLSENVAFHSLEKEKKEIKENFVENEPEKRCHCGKLISEQRAGSRFCSEKYKGRIAKKCRNQDSNIRRDKKKIVMKAKETNQYLIIGYLWKGVLYSDTLHSSEVNPCREWLDRVVSVKAVPDVPGESVADNDLIYSEAREFLCKLADKNGQNV